MTNQNTNTLAQSLEEISVEMLELLTSKRTVVRCNYRDSRSGGRSYAAWTITYDYQITEPNGDVYWYSMSHYNGYKAPVIVEAPQEIWGATELSWEEVPTILVRYHFDVLLPQFNLQGNSILEFRLFEFGLEKGQEKYKRDLFLKENSLGWIVHEDNPKIVYDQFGPWTDFRIERIKDYEYLVQLDNGAVLIQAHRWDGAILDKFFGSKEQFEEEYEKILLRAEKARVPFSIALLTEQIEDEKQALKVLEELAYVKLNFRAGRFKNVRFFDEKDKNFVEKQLQEYKKLLGFRLFKKVDLGSSLEVFENYLYK